MANIFKESKINLEVHSPQVTQRSTGFFYVRVYKKTGNWSLYHESWKDAGKVQEKIPTAMYFEFGLTQEMSLEQARSAITEYNKLRKKRLGVSLSQIRSMQRLQEMKSVDKILFPPSLVEEFIVRLQDGSDGKPRFKKRLVTCFGIVQKIATEIELKPHEYKDEL